MLSNVYAENGHFSKFKCNSGANPGQVKRWHYDKKSLVEIYPNGYKRVYDIQNINETKIQAIEDSVRGTYFVSIYLDKDNIKIEVNTPLTTYVDNNCKKLKWL